MKKNIKRTWYVFIVFAFLIVHTILPVDAAVISKSVSNTHAIIIPESPIFITVAVKTKNVYDGTYKDSGNDRIFTKHSESVSFSSINDPYLTRKLKTSTGYLKFSSPTKTCNHVNCNCSFFIGNTTFLHKHHCSNTKVTCKKGSSTYCVGGYVITGGSTIVSKNVKFSGLAK